MIIKTIRTWAFLLLVIAAIGCKKDKGSNSDINLTNENKLSGIYITPEIGTSGKYWYISHPSGTVMRQSTNHLFGSVSLNDLKERSYITSFSSSAYRPNDIQGNTSKRIATIFYHEAPDLTKYVWFTYSLAGVYHLGVEELLPGESFDIEQILRNKNFWFYVHLYDKADGDRQRVVIESAIEDGLCLANEGHYSTGTNFIRFYKRNSQAEIDSFEKWEIGKP